jgi:hypothetical protein
MTRRWLSFIYLFLLPTRIAACGLPGSARLHVSKLCGMWCWARAFGLAAALGLRPVSVSRASPEPEDLSKDQKPKAKSQKPKAAEECAAKAKRVRVTSQLR